MKVRTCLGAFTICLLFLSSCTEITSQSCLPYMLDVNLQERIQRSEVVLNGTDITPKGNDSACEADPASCGRRVIRFKVNCILKGSHFSIPEEVTIGVRDEIQACDATVFGYNERNKDYIVLLKYVPGTIQLEWDEFAGKSAKLTMNEVVIETIYRTCGLTGAGWIDPKDNQCPKEAKSEDCGKTCPKEWNHIDGECIYISTEHKGTPEEALEYCENMHASLVSLSEESIQKVQDIVKRSADRWWLRPEAIEDDDKEVSGNDTMSMKRKHKFMTVGATGLREAQGDNETNGFMCGKDVEPVYPLMPKSDPKEILVVHINPEKLFGQVCCRRYYNRKGTFVITKWDKLINSKDLVTQPFKIEYNLGKQGSLYSVILADISGSSYDKGTRHAPYIYWMVVNVPYENGVLDLASGNVTLDYSGPVPRNEDVEPYIFSVYKQARAIDSTEISNVYVYGEQSCANKPRCHFQIKLWEQSWKLTQEAGFSFGVALDEYAVDQWMRSQAGRITEKEGCLKYWPDTKLTYGVVACESKRASGATRLYSSSVFFFVAVMNLFYIML